MRLSDEALLVRGRGGLLSKSAPTLARYLALLALLPRPSGWCIAILSLRSCARGSCVTERDTKRGPDTPRADIGRRGGDIAGLRWWPHMSGVTELPTVVLLLRCLGTPRALSELELTGASGTDKAASMSVAYCLRSDADQFRVSFRAGGGGERLMRAVTVAPASPAGGDGRSLTLVGAVAVAITAYSASVSGEVRAPDAGDTSRLR